ncbi:hypothetical protein AVL60_02930 [Kocuria palustris]|nr:hypothetical protein AVL60_02930 [Kocuria palustris]
MWVKSDCQQELGRSASKRCSEDLGRLRGWAVMSPSRCRIRAIVAREGMGSSGRVVARVAAMVAGPASRPWVVSSVRRAVITRIVAGGVAAGCPWGVEGLV